MLGVKPPQEKSKVQFEIDWNSDASSWVLSQERPGIDRVLVFAVGLGLKQFKPRIYCEVQPIKFGHSAHTAI